MHKPYVVKLAAEERTMLEGLIAAGTGQSRNLTHARILLKADAAPDGLGWVDDRVAEAVDVSQSTVVRERWQYVEGGLDAALTRRSSRRVYRRKLDCEQEARLTDVTYSEPPTGQARWTLCLLADKLVELEAVGEV
jgi:hypothetical protein